MAKTCDEKFKLGEILVSEKELNSIDFERSPYIKNNLIVSDNNMYLTTADSLIYIYI